MGLASPYLAMANAMHGNRPGRTNDEPINILRGRSRDKNTSPLNQAFARTIKRRRDLISEAVADADAIVGSSHEPSPPKNSKGLNTTPIVWMCIIIVAVILLVVFCVFGHRRQKQRDGLAEVAGSEERQKLPQVGIVG
jgi:type VI protein secretion system component VasF